MINIYYTYLPSAGKAGLLIAGNPAIGRQLARAPRTGDLPSFVAGRWLLAQILATMQVPYSLDDIRFNEAGRPAFPGPPHFSISHSGNLAVCAIAPHTIGIDLEQEKEIALPDFEDYFSREEWAAIRRSATPYADFYRAWTAKEAILKADGTGPDAFPEINGLAAVQFRGNSYYLEEIRLEEGYACHVAATAPIRSITVKELSIP
ncbi:4'-phosphopantetheinyl transferase superfamily protein [Chitinophaga terrae (ex Kim and Jung 2007)]|uniref:4'-phosphopantetheinyl transferase superfamily protein n=1 Tax=Chitinophaga terrae (ex Kim and Jung 2007) TaxID=408074 RepID=A0A1H3ZGF1_9BACT|nr:4'-phosphopantetheinyl transferase superfamily protein [Chitinophaga terrae (ex Kim and Jung 2007)]SEA22727.1 4'-phosphopantetheinyl transferase superfamily protein [Chitinophaga terrae (ex Kim and Jung 2007)]